MNYFSPNVVIFINKILFECLCRSVSDILDSFLPSPPSSTSDSVGLPSNSSSSIPRAVSQEERQLQSLDRCVLSLELDAIIEEQELIAAEDSLAVSSASENACGNIHHPRYRAFWRDVLRADEYILGILEHGLKFPFEDEAGPPPYEEDNNQSARREMAFVRESVQKMVAEGVVSQVNEKPHSVSPLTVAFRTLPDGSVKRRLCWDGSRSVNPAMKRVPCRLSGLPVVADLLDKGDHQLIFDLSQFYYHVKLHPSHKKFTGFKVPREDDVTVFDYYVYNCLAFGVSPAAGIVTRITKPVMSYIARKGVKASLYLDDGKLNGQDKSKLQEQFTFCLQVFTDAGFVVNRLKSDSVEDASTRKSYLGFEWDSSLMKVFISEDKEASIIRSIEKVLSRDWVTAKDAASCIGKIISIKIAVGPLARILTRSAYVDLQLAVGDGAYGWSSRFRWSADARRELSLFKTHLHALNGFCIERPEKRRPIQDWIVAGDASGVGACSYSVQAPSAFFFQDLFSQEEASLSSGHRELLTLKKALDRSAFPKNAEVLWYTDSENLVSFWTKGSRNPITQSVLVDACLLALEKDVVLQVVHLSRTDPLLEAADEGSRQFDANDWGVSDSDFFHLCNVLGLEPTLDVFASPTNARCKRFFSLYKYHGSAGLDAFSLDWSGETVFACPPVRDIPAVIRKIQLQHVRGFLVVPRWSTSFFWPRLFPDGVHATEPFYKLLKIRPELRFGPFYRGGMHRRNPYEFMALAFDHAAVRRLTNVCDKGGCQACA